MNSTNTAVEMKQCQSYHEGPLTKLFPLPQIDDDTDYEDEGIYTCHHGVKMSRRDTTICNNCYWESQEQPDEQSTLHEETLQEKGEEDKYNDEYNEMKSIEDECYQFDLYERDEKYLNGICVTCTHDLKKYMEVCKRIADYEEKYICFVD